ncbi:hypothetical protein IFM89_015294 [Coptis chinensis]|uniref:Myb-like domain-containing protein n=1 Tax=Coptis chinensis TaxID=261450 RepID=A0A835IRC3_9MAGN|nr:hypothetical protein IFM89_015294 [Coptis chinensis]
MDAKDILGLPKISFSASQEKKSRPQKDSQRKPDGISREVYALTGGLAPLMPSIDPLHLKRKALLEKEKAPRKDDLQLYHWVRVVNGVPPTGDYSFAKYNKSVDVVKYTEEEYLMYLNDPAWTKEETDQLFDLCERFDLRFIVIADRFQSSRRVEELKSRYYAVSRAITAARAPTSGDVSGNHLLKEPYNIHQEIERKRALSMVLSQTKQQERKDAEVLAEAKRITESRVIAKERDESQVFNRFRINFKSNRRTSRFRQGCSASQSVFQVSIPSSPTAAFQATLTSSKALPLRQMENVSDLLEEWANYQFPHLVILHFCFAICKLDNQSFIFLQAAEEAELAACLSDAHENNERILISVDSVSPTSISQFPIGAVPPPAPDSSVIPSTLRMLRVFLRSNALEQMVQAASSSAGLRTIKRVDQTLQDLQVNLKPKVPTVAVCQEHLELRKEILTLLNLQKQLQYKEAEASTHREGSYTETPSTPKAPGRFLDPPPSPPQSKRARKLKASD